MGSVSVPNALFQALKGMREKKVRQLNQAIAEKKAGLEEKLKKAEIEKIGMETVVKEGEAKLQELERLKAKREQDEAAEASTSERTFRNRLTQTPNATFGGPSAPPQATTAPQPVAPQPGGTPQPQGPAAAIMGWGEILANTPVDQRDEMLKVLMSKAKVQADARKSNAQAGQAEATANLLKGAGGGEKPVVTGITPSGPTFAMPKAQAKIAGDKAAAVAGARQESKAREALAGFAQVDEIFKQIELESNSIIKATDAKSALKQAIELNSGAFSRSNTVAASYRDSKEAFLGILARQLGGERGVLTDRDIERIGTMLPGFRDTVQIKELKLTKLRDIMAAAKKAQQQLGGK